MRVSTKISAATMVLALTACTATVEPSATPTPAPTDTATAAPTTVPSATPPGLPPATPTSVVWESHGPVTDKTSTAYVAVNPVDGNVWVGVPFENLFWIFSADGTYLESWGTGGTGPGQFDFSDHNQTPDGFAPIAFAPDGSFYVGDTGNHRVQAFDASRSFVREWGSFGTDAGEFVQITSIATDGATVYVADGDRNDIQAFDTSGTFLRIMGADGGFNAIAIDGNGRVYATNPETPTGAARALAIFDADGTEIRRIPIGSASLEPLQLAVDAAGNSFVPLRQSGDPETTKSIVQFDPSGTMVAVWEGGGDYLAVAPGGGALYAGHGDQLDTTQWTFARKYVLSGS